MDLVVDASVAYKWLVAEDDSDVALTLRSDHDIVAPICYWSNVGTPH